MKIELSRQWYVMQDVHDIGETMKIYSGDLDLTEVGHQLSEFEPIDRLEHLQVLLSDTPYWGRQLRQFNAAPWWYLNEFEVDALESTAHSVVRFSNVDYFCRVWMNGVFLGEHEGYSVPFELDATKAIRSGEKNQLMVKVWSPWDSAIRGDAIGQRTYQVERDLVKGTYEHDDTLIARDVNPVGIYGSVTVESHEDAFLVGSPRVTYVLSSDRTQATVAIKGVIGNPAGVADATVRVRVRDRHTMIGSVIDTEYVVDLAQGQSEFEVAFDLPDVKLWNLWDRGEPHLYEIEVSIAGSPAHTTVTGFRTVELLRDTEQSTFWINGRSTFLRGTSYFPDLYVSTMNAERYRRDLLAMRVAGFNTVRVHVHVENKAFYALCDELGFAVIQDSEYNWTHPLSQEWAQRLVSIFEQTLLFLDEHPSIVCWVCLNEPGFSDPEGGTDGVAMRVSPGPQLYEAVTALDPSRPAIKGSYCEDDLTSGDSHNYVGSLERTGVPYTEIDGTVEKLNTEFGFDAPGCVGNLRKTGKLFTRIESLMPLIPQLQEYQYRLHKYYIESYRVKKYRPTSGYVQFMFTDLSPQSFYGVYDWWGFPKRVLDALLESNQPVAVLVEQNARESQAIWLVNDSASALGLLTVSWWVTDAPGSLLESGSCEVACGADSSVRVADLKITAARAAVLNVVIVAKDSDGVVVARNRYDDMFGHPPHPVGHPDRMSHEFGVRLFGSP